MELFKQEKPLKNYILFLLILMFSWLLSGAQELNCVVTVSSQQVQGTDNQRIFDNLQRQVSDFYNTRFWTKDKFDQNERIDCSVFIDISSKSTDYYTATIEVQCRRPVFKTGYNTPLFNFQDKNFGFGYIENSSTFATWNIQNYSDNLTAVLAFYAYVILAVDYDSFSPLGGTEYWKNAQMIVNSAQVSEEMGWKSSDGTRNRYIFIDNIMNQMYQPIRDTYYSYHRKGLDLMYDKAEDGRAAILQSIDNLKEVNKNRPGSMNMQMFFETKNQEIVNIFMEATDDEKNKLLDILNIIDAADQNIYSKIKSPK